MLLARIEAGALTLAGSEHLASRRDPNRWRLWIIVAAPFITTGSRLLIEWPGPFNFLFMLVFGLGFLVLLATLAIASCVFAFKKRFRSALSTLLALVIMIAMGRPAIWATEYFHMVLTTQLGVGQLGATGTQSGKPFAVYDWSVGLISNGNTFLIKDITDEIALPAAKRTHSTAFFNGFDQECGGNVQHLTGHYYICHF